MKIRIKGNSIRLRLTKTDIKTLTEVQIIEETTDLGNGIIFRYSLALNAETEHIYANFSDGRISVFLNQSAYDTLTATNEITVHHTAENGTSGGLFLLIEKDLKCLDTTFEDQSDMYENPKTHC